MGTYITFVYIYIYIPIFKYTCIHMYRYIYIYIHLCLCFHIYIYLHISYIASTDLYTLCVNLSKTTKVALEPETRRTRSEWLIRYRQVRPMYDRGRDKTRLGDFSSPSPKPEPRTTNPHCRTEWSSFKPQIYPAKP